MEYLDNPVCKFTPLFDFNTEPQNMVVISWTQKQATSKNHQKMLFQINRLVDQTMSGFVIRLFVDQSVKQNKKAMGMIKSLSHVQPVLAEYKNDSVKANELTHLFQLFDLPNNDGKLVITGNTSHNKDSYKIFNSYRILKQSSPQIVDRVKQSSLMTLVDTLIYTRKFVADQKGNGPQFDKSTLNQIPYLISGQLLSYNRFDPRILLEFDFPTQPTKGKNLATDFLNNRLMVELIKTNKTVTILARHNLHNLINYVHYDCPEGPLEKMIVLTKRDNYRLRSKKDLTKHHTQLAKRVAEQVDLRPELLPKCLTEETVETLRMLKYVYKGYYLIEKSADKFNYYPIKEIRVAE